MVLKMVFKLTSNNQILIVLFLLPFPIPFFKNGWSGYTVLTHEGSNPGAGTFFMIKLPQDPQDLHFKNYAQNNLLTKTSPVGFEPTIP